MSGIEKQLDKGLYGEDIVHRLLREKDIYVYKADSDRSHPFDFIGVHGIRYECCIIEVKSIPRRNKYKDNCVKLDVWKGYKEWKRRTGLDFLLIFVDEMVGEVYGNMMSELERSYVDKKRNMVYPLSYKPVYGDQYIYFHLDSMKKFGTLSEEEKEELKKRSSRNHPYKY